MRKLRKLRASWAVRLVALVLLMGTLLPQRASAQWLTTDIPHIGVQLAEFAKKAADWVKTIENYGVVKDAFQVASVAKDISGRIRDISDQVRGLTQEGLDYAHAIQDALKRVAAIKDLRISNLDDLKNLALSISNFNLTNSMPLLGQTQAFTQALASADLSATKTIKDGLNTISTTTGRTRTAAGQRAQRTTAAMSQLAVENKAQEDKIRQAMEYKRMADELATTAAETQGAAKTDAQLKMTDGERLEIQSRSADMMLKAQELREKSSRLLAEAAIKGPAQLAAEQVVFDQQQVGGLNAMHHAIHQNEGSDY